MAAVTESIRSSAVVSTVVFSSACAMSSMFCRYDLKTMFGISALIERQQCSLATVRNTEIIERARAGASEMAVPMVATEGWSEEL